MDTQRIVTEIDAEIARLHQVRALLIGGVGAKRRGRPPKSPVTLNGATAQTPARKTRTFTAAQRKAQSQRLKAYWRNKRKEAGKG
jgi:hypothetical protein